MTNPVRHAGARGVEVTFTACPGALTVTVTDDGTGFGADKTVRNHVGSIFAKLRVPDRAAAIVRARDAGLGSG
ncbi:hypothetical protein ACFQVD_13610 [Streptosporangium amethystogenes subsp. fukuiense]|uniref:Histidine kinase/HSP90-like ATPase domain-containing protein n=1 Tax=Streptosporangium amethystogenes subsp. fukuiense TaxID=698418 RepID=A0ABW2SXS9_9ACTN